jgi:hypothetical protein
MRNRGGECEERQAGQEGEGTYGVIGSVVSGPGEREGLTMGASSRCEIGLDCVEKHKQRFHDFMPEILPHFIAEKLRSLHSSFLLSLFLCLLICLIYSCTPLWRHFCSCCGQISAAPSCPTKPVPLPPIGFLLPFLFPSIVEPSPLPPPFKSSSTRRYRR